MSGAGSDLFISYSRADEAFVRQLDHRLTGAGRTVWVDIDDIPPTAEWMAEVRRAIDASTAFAFVLSPASIRSQVCAQELDHALSGGKRLIPIVREPVDPAEAHPALAARNWLWFSAEDDFDQATDLLLSAMDTDLEWARDHTRLLVRATEWHTHQEDRSYLLRGRDLTGGETWLASAAGREPRPTELHHRYLAESRRGERRVQRRRLIAAGVAVVVALSLAVVAVIQRNEAIHQAEVARARGLAAGARAELGADPELSVMLAARALEIQATADNHQILRTALESSFVRSLLHTGGAPVVSATFSADGERALVATSEGTVLIYDARSSRVLARHELGHEVLSAVLSEDGDVVALAVDRGVELWTIGARDTTLLSMGSGSSAVIGILPGDREVVGADADGTINVWDIRSGDLQSAHETNGSRVTALAVSPAGRELAISTDVATSILDLRNGETRRIQPRSSLYLHYSGDGHRLLYEAPQPTVVDLRNPVRKAELDDGGFTTSVGAISPDGQRVFLGGIDGVGRLWYVNTDRVGLELRADQSLITSVGFHPDGQHMISGSTDGSVRVWATGARSQLPTSSIHSPVATSDGSIATLERNGVTHVWDGHTGELKGTFGTPTEEGWSSPAIAISPHGDLVASAARGNVEVWDTSDGRRRVNLTVWSPSEGSDQPTTEVNALAFSPDGRNLAVAVDDGSVRIYPISGRRIPRVPRFFVWSAPNGWPFSLDFDARGDRLAVGYTDGLVVWDTQGAGRELQSFEPRGGSAGAAPVVLDVALSADGTRLISATSEQVIRIWDVATGRPSQVLEGQAGSGSSAAFNEAGDLAVTGSDEGVARVWDLRTGTVRATFRGRPGHAVTDVGFVPGPDPLVVVNGRSTTIHRCSLCVPDRELLDLAATRVTRALTADEREEFGLAG